VRSWLDG